MNFKFVSIIALTALLLIGKVSSAQKSGKTFNYISFKTNVHEDDEMVVHENETLLNEVLKKPGMESLSDGMKFLLSSKSKPIELLNDLGLMGYELITILENNDSHKRTYFLKKEIIKAESPCWDPKTVH